jgi:hypothetical protein
MVLYASYVCLLYSRFVENHPIDVESMSPSSLVLSQLVGVFYPKYHRPPLMVHSSEYDRFPPVANGWGTIHSISDMAPPLLAKEEGPPI